MGNQQLFDYIKQQLQQGLSKKEIKNLLMASGWQEKEIEEVFISIQNSVDKMSTPNLKNNVLPGALVLLKKALAIYKENLVTLIVIMAIPALITFLIFGKLVGSQLFFSEFLANNIFLSIALTILIIGVIFVSYTWSQIAIIYAVKDSQEKLGPIESYRRSWHKLFSYLWICLLSIFITFGGFLLLLIPGIILEISFILAIFVLIFENLKGMDALLKSREYVKGHWFKVFGYLLFILFLSLLFLLFLTFIFRFFKISFGLEIINIISQLFLPPLIIVYLFLVYNNLKNIKGEIVFSPSKKNKVIFVLIGIFGLLIILGGVLKVFLTFREQNLLLL